MEIRKRTGAATWLLGILAAVMLICSGKTAYAAEQAELSGGNVDAHVLQQAMRRVIGRWVGRHLRRRPMIVPVVVLQ